MSPGPHGTYQAPTRRPPLGVDISPLSPEMVMTVSPPRPSPRCAGTRHEDHLSTALLARILKTTAPVHAAGQRSFGLLLAHPLDPDFPSPRRTSLASTPPRPDATTRLYELRGQGEYFRAYDDTGFEADCAEILQIHRQLDVCHPRRRRAVPRPSPITGDLSPSSTSGCTTRRTGPADPLAPRPGTSGTAALRRSSPDRPPATPC